MIFATVGTQLPFARLALYLEDIAMKRDEDILFQCADENWQSEQVTVRAFMAPDAFEKAFQDARMVIGHAGIGTVLTARRLGKPLVIVPRQFMLGEHRNDHQMATAAQLAKESDIAVAHDLHGVLAAIANPPQPQRVRQRPEREKLIAHIARFLET